jgi:hypothetical protein
VAPLASCAQLLHHAGINLLLRRQKPFEMKGILHRRSPTERPTQNLLHWTPRPVPRRKEILDPITLALSARSFYHIPVMPFPIRTCVLCHEQFELRPDKPGFANRCPACTEEAEESKRQATSAAARDAASVLDPRSSAELNAARRKAMRDMLYHKDS